MHSCGFSPLWMSMCCFRCPACLKESPHCAHLCTFSPVWVIMCVLKWPARPNDFSHSGQVWAFTPLWVSMCAFRCPAWPNDLWHWTQVYFLFLLWISKCIFRFPARLNDFLHSGQVCVFTPLWVTMCIGILLFETATLFTFEFKVVYSSSLVCHTMIETSNTCMIICCHFHFLRSCFPIFKLKCISSISYFFSFQDQN